MRDRVVAAWTRWRGPRRPVLRKGVVVILCIGAVASALSEPIPEDAAAERALLQAVNDYRAAQGLPRWRADPVLAAIGRAHSRAMARDGRLSHEGFRARAARSGSALCVENLVAGASAPEQAVALWRRSPAHHQNLLEPAVAWAGVGVVGRYATLLACATPAVRADPPESGASTP
jgi:uncharacterized protein YkwD